MLIVIGDATAAPGRRQDLIAAAKAVAAATREDSGCLSYGFFADIENEKRIVSIEIWQDRAALDQHMQHNHTAEFLRVAPDLVAEEPTMTFHEVPDTNQPLAQPHRDAGP
jgi:quinol monooxygenase YgiN